MSDLQSITNRLRDQIEGLQFPDPVAYVYNPLDYARRPWARYLEKYGQAPKEVLLLGMNPGPWGMAQTGIPFGEVSLVRDWLGVEAPVDQPQRMHPKKPVTGFACPRHEVSGQRLWGWAKERFVKPEAFLARFLVINYCPLLFLDEAGRNLTPELMPKGVQQDIHKICDQALAETVKVLQPRYVIGVGRYAEKRAREVLGDFPGTIAYITHPSPANPKANRGWSQLIETELQELGIKIG